MKKILIFGLLVMLSNSIYGQTTKFIEYAVGHLKCRNCYFIPLNVESKAYSGKIIVDNYALFSYLKATKKLDEKGYKSFMLDLLKNNQALTMDAVEVDREIFLAGKNIEKYAFRIVRASQSFDDISAQGCKKIIRYYFVPELVESETGKESDCKESIKQNAKDLLIKPKFDLNEQNNIISKLFELEIPIYIDDIAGSPKIGHLTLK
jgi:hypothetical protein